MKRVNWFKVRQFLDTAYKAGIVGAIAALFVMAVFSTSNVEYTKAKAPEMWQDNGFEVVGYQGYQTGFRIPFTTYGGARVWYTLRKPGTNLLFHGGAKRWGDEVHMGVIVPIDPVVNFKHQ